MEKTENKGRKVSGVRKQPHTAEGRIAIGLVQQAFSPRPCVVPFGA
jgi:hypothetical protein